MYSKFLHRLTSYNAKDGDRKSFRNIPTLADMEATQPIILREDKVDGDETDGRGLKVGGNLIQSKPSETNAGERDKHGSDGEGLEKQLAKETKEDVDQTGKKVGTDTNLPCQFDAVVLLGEGIGKARIGRASSLGTNWRVRIVDSVDDTKHKGEATGSIQTIGLGGVRTIVLLRHTNGLMSVVAVTKKEHDTSSWDDALEDNVGENCRGRRETKDGKGKTEKSRQVVEEQGKETDKVS